MAGKFQLRSRNWDLISIVGSVLLAVLGFGGILLVDSGTPTMLLLVVLGIVTFLLFAGPGIVYSARKRIPVLKKRLPGSTMAWIRAHLYLPILALVAAFVHATVAPFQGVLSSGKVTLLVGTLVAVAGWYRHRLLGIETEALNAKSQIGKLVSDQDREFRLLVADLTEDRRPLSEIEAQAAKLSPGQAVIWQEVRELYDRVKRHFPQAGRQTQRVRHYKLWRFLHVPLTFMLFALLAYHVWDVLGGKKAVLSDEKEQFAASSQCAGCHTEIFGEWGISSMAHAQTSTIMEAQLPVTIAENKRLAAGGLTDPKRQQQQKDQQRIFDQSAKTCINCHAQVGARFAEQIDALLPLDEPGSAGAGAAAVEGGGDAVQEDGVGCVVCHTQASPPPELSAAGELAIATGGAADYGTQFGPLFKNPDALPVRVHEVEPGEGGVWNTPTGSSQLCGACHNVKLDLDGDGTSAFQVKEGFEDETSRRDTDGDFQLDQNELDLGDDGKADDLVLQTTFDEWQDYVVGFEKRFEKDPRQRLDQPLSCAECHMPTRGDGTQAVVEHAPGLQSPPERLHRSHSFVGVDYDLDPAAYEKEGLPPDALKRALAEREALLGSAVTLEVVNRGEIARRVFQADVVVRNNLLGHAFPTGFAFARQFWLEVSAKTTSGQDVCLRSPDGRLKTPCASGVITRGDEDLKQCDPLSVKAVNPRFTGDEAIKFATSFPADACDPWLANFQKILTDGDPDGDGVFNEVPYQSFLPDIVKNRTRTALQLPMTELQPVRLRADAKGKLQEDFAGFYPYLFDTTNVPAGERIVVRAKLRFRHLPPDFVRALATRLDQLDDVPQSARIDPEKLLQNMVITDVVEAESDKGEVLACEGPQNKAGGTIFDCLDEEDASVAASGVVSAAGPPDDSRRRPPADYATLSIAAVLFLATTVTVIRRRRTSRP